MPKVKTSFSIVASGARELSGCDSSAEVEMQRAEGEGELMPVRSSQIPHNLERTTLQKMNATEGLLARQLYPAGQVTLDRMLAKDWIEKQMDAKAGAKYRITPAGEAALKAKTPDPLGDVSRTSRVRAESDEIVKMATILQLSGRPA